MERLSTQDSSAVERGVALLRAGGVLIFPTETTYGIGCDATNEEAVARVFSIKGRPSGKGLPVLVPSLAFAEEFVQVEDATRVLASRYWPGDLNIALRLKPGSSLALSVAEDGYQSVRVSSHPFASALVRAFGGPVVATSANISGQNPLYSLDGVEELFADREEKPDLVLDDGELPPRAPSTIAKIVGGRIQILRQGSVVVPSTFL